MSRRASTRKPAREAKRADFYAAAPEDDGEPDAEPVCGSCGASLEHAGDDCPLCGEEN